MKKIFHIILFITTLCTAIFAQPEDTNNFSGQAKSIFISYENIPTKVYVGQIFPIKVKAIIAKDRIDDIATTFSNSNSVEIINPDSKWVSSANNIYYNTFNLQIKAQPAVLPTLSINILEGGQIIENENVQLPMINVVKLKQDSLFSNVIADSLNVKKYKTTSFDSKNLIIVLEIEATYSNLKDFALNSIAKNGVDSFNDNAPNQKIYYYAIIPNYQKTFDFTYFNLPTNKFIKFSLPIIIEDEEVSTQLGLNPKESIFEFYKTIGYGVISFIFLILFLKRKGKFYLLISLLFLGLFFIDKNPLNNVTLKENSSVMILPTEKSTVFFTSNKTLPAEKLAQRGIYIKILLPDGKIGWTLSENIIKN